MFAPPRVSEAQAFARYPDELRNGTAATDERRPAGRAGGACFLEGPSFDRHGVLWSVDIVNGRLLNVSSDGRFSVAVESMAGRTD